MFFFIFFISEMLFTIFHIVHGSVLRQYNTIQQHRSPWNETMQIDPTKSSSFFRSNWTYFNGIRRFKSWYWSEIFSLCATCLGEAFDKAFKLTDFEAVIQRYTVDKLTYPEPATHVDEKKIEQQEINNNISSSVAVSTKIQPWAAVKRRPTMSSSDRSPKDATSTVYLAELAAKWTTFQEYMNELISKL